MAAIDASGGSSKTEPAKEPPKLALDLTKDTATRGDATSGLGEVFVQMDSNALADDVADIALTALRDAHVATPWKIRVVTEPAAFGGSDALGVLTHQATLLNEALDAVLGEPVVFAVPDDRLNLMAAAGIAMPVAAASLNVIGMVSKLLAHDYQLSGKAVETKDLGFDVLLAQKLTSKHPLGVEVAVDRIAPTDVAGTTIARTLADLYVRAHNDLAPVLAHAAAHLAMDEGDVAALTAQRDALNTQIIELIKNIASAAAELADTRGHVAALENLITMARVNVAVSKARHDRLATLAKEVEDFLTMATTTPANGRAPLVEAARAEALGTEYVLYARLIAGGMDEIIDVRTLRSDTWTALAGASVEYELLHGSTMLASGVRSTLQASEFNLADLARNKQDYVRYVPVPRFVP